MIALAIRSAFPCVRCNCARFPLRLRLTQIGLLFVEPLGDVAETGDSVVARTDPLLRPTALVLVQGDALLGGVMIRLVLAEDAEILQHCRAQLLDGLYLIQSLQGMLALLLARGKGNAELQADRAPGRG